MSIFDQNQIWENQGYTSGSMYSKHFRQSLESKYTSQWKSHISKSENPNSPNKLKNYAEFKNDFKIENYVLSCPLETRRNFTKFRISAHSLAIETGRYTKPKTPREERICTLCNRL